MEKKKIVLVAISVGVFLVILIGVSILIFAPKSPSPAAAVTSTPAKPQNELDTILPAPAPDTVPDPDKGEQGLETPPGGDKKADDNVFYIYGENPGKSNTPVKTVTAEPPKKTPPAKTTAKPKPKAPAAPPKQKTPAPAPKAKSKDNYWVQTGSFSTQIRAEGCKELLASKGIQSLIENREVNGKIYFRVRVGPYTSKNEADYWLALIKTIDGFEQSQVWKSPSAM